MSLLGFVSACGGVRLATAVFAMACAVLGALAVIVMVACAPLARSPSAHATVWPPAHAPADVVTPTYVQT